MKKKLLGLALIVLLLLISVVPAFASAPGPLDTKLTQLQATKTITVNVHMEGCVDVFSGFPPMLNPTGCSPLNNGYWQVQVDGGYIQTGPATNTSGNATVWLTVPVGSHVVKYIGYDMTYETALQSTNTFNGSLYSCSVTRPC